MGIICGWLDHQVKDAQSVIHRMLHTGAEFLDESDSHCSADQATIGYRGTDALASICKSNELIAVIEGNPRWRDANLAELAANEGDSRALTEGFSLNGMKILNQLCGEFALCILNPLDNYALLAVDRVGVRPLAYSAKDQFFVFGSVIGSILSHPSIERDIDPQGIFNYLYFHMVPSPATIFKGIRKLQPGEYVEFNNGKIDRRFYWELEYSEDKVSEKRLASELRSELRQAVITCMSEKPTGTFLSGGLDSSTVTGVMQSLSDERIDAYAIGFEAEGFDEMDYARASANHFGVTLNEYYVTPQDVLDAIPSITAAYDEPFGNASAIPAYYCARFARENGKTLLLAGDGGDEIFAGNARYVKQKLFNIYQHVPVILKSALIEPIATGLPPLKKLKSYIEQSKIPMPERMETYNFLHRTSLKEIFSSDFLSKIDPEVPLRYLKDQYDRSDDIPLVKKMLFLDHKFTLADNDLRKVNRMCELAGIDVRYPLLQDNMMEFAARIPANMLLRGFELRSFYRRAMKGMLAKETLNKNKHGFGLPFGLWMNEYQPLKEFADDSLERIKQRGFLNPSYIETLIAAHQSGHASYYGVMIWVLIMLEQWLDAHT